MSAGIRAVKHVHENSSASGIPSAFESIRFDVNACGIFFGRYYNLSG